MNYVYGLLILLSVYFMSRNRFERIGQHRKKTVAVFERIDVQTKSGQRSYYTYNVNGKKYNNYIGSAEKV